MHDKNSKLHPYQQLDTRGVIGRISRLREQANLIIEQELFARGITGIVPAHGSVLAFLFSQKGPVPIKEVVEKVGRVKSTVTGMVKTLEHHGYLTKIRSEVDSRIVNIALTPKGMALREPFEEISEILLKRVYGDISKEEQQTLVGLLARVEQNLLLGSKE